MAEIIHRTVRRETHTPDPYARSKRDATAQAMTLLPGLRERVRGAPDPLETSVRIAIAGNIIDDGMVEPFDLEATLARVLEQPFAIDGLALRDAQRDRAPVFFLLQGKCSVIAGRGAEGSIMTDAPGINTEESKASAHLLRCPDAFMTIRLTPKLCVLQYRPPYVGCVSSPVSRTVRHALPLPQEVVAR